ncbi:hypothetical protein GOP47_0010115 [Adiantum capillus-veneris]|uniref:Uncharacterized protein n=1 Tax=Adiantum capillus-veneris TaxID=13818 RepID=A0A9D4ZG37_ADICA|nr:hypothetical protein GOP47_0010115 [Adiantum capillus-veneris]
MDGRFVVFAGLPISNPAEQWHPETREWKFLEDVWSKGVKVKRPYFTVFEGEIFALWSKSTVAMFEPLTDTWLQLGRVTADASKIQYLLCVGDKLWAFLETDDQDSNTENSLLWIYAACVREVPARWERLPLCIKNIAKDLPDFIHVSCYSQFDLLIEAFVDRLTLVKLAALPSWKVRPYVPFSEHQLQSVAENKLLLCYIITQKALNKIIALDSTRQCFSSSFHGNKSQIFDDLLSRTNILADFEVLNLVHVQLLGHSNVSNAGNAALRLLLSIHEGTEVFSWCMCAGFVHGRPSSAVVAPAQYCSCTVVHHPQFVTAGHWWVLPRNLHKPLLLDFHVILSYQVAPGFDCTEAAHHAALVRTANTIVCLLLVIEILSLMIH